MKNIVFMVAVKVPGMEGRSEPYKYGINSFKYWCEKNNCELFVLDDAQGIYSIAQYRKKKFHATQTEKIWAMFLEHVSTQNQL